MNWDYLAGFIDGEGTIAINYQADTPQLLVGQSSRQIIDVVQQFLGGGSIRSRNDFFFEYRIGGFKVIPILTELVPRLYVKRVVGEAVLDFAQCRVSTFGQGRANPLDTHCLQLKERVRTLNTKPRQGLSGLRGGV